jgi:malate dehydrogenase
VNVGVIGGAGTVGASVAFNVAMSGLAKRIVLVDLKENVAMSHVMDIEQAVCEQKAVSLEVGDYGLLKDCQVVVVAVGAPERQVGSRDDYLALNIDIIRSLAPKLVASCPNAIFITISNPLDALNYTLYKLTGLRPEQFIGYSRNDSVRFKWAIGRALGVTPHVIGAIVMGEHGDKQVPLFSQVTVEGRKLDLDLEHKETINGLIRTWFLEWQKLDSGRTTGWTSGTGMIHLLRAIAEKSRETIPCSVVLQGQYGLSDLCLGVPVRLCKTGVKEIVQLDLTEQEKEALNSAATKVRSVIAKCMM